MKLHLLFGLATVSVAASGALPPPPIVLHAARFDVGFDPTGAIAFTRHAGKGADAPSICFTRHGGSLWRLHFRDGTTLSSSDEPAPAIERADDAHVTFSFDTPRARVIVRAAAGDDLVDIAVRVERPDADVIGIECPADLSFDPRSVRRAIVPEELGVALKRGFFLPQKDPGTWTSERVGPDGLQTVAGLQCALRPSLDAPVGLSIGPAGQRLLGPALIAAWAGRVHRADRPASSAPCMTVIDSPNGPFLAGHLVGSGLLLRFGSSLAYSDTALVLSTVQRLIGRLQAAPDAAPGYSPGAKRNRVVLVALRHGPVVGGWCAMRVGDWRSAIDGSPYLKGEGLVTEVAWSVDEMLNALHNPQTLAVIDPYGEALPIGDRSFDSVSGEVKRYLQDGGIWVATGGWPFYFGLKSSPYLSLDANTFVQFSDFVHLDSEAGRISLFSVQDDREIGAIYVPTTMSVGADADGGYISRRWQCFVGRGQQWDTPPLRMLFGLDAAAAAQCYATANGFTRTLEEKVRPDVLDKWKRSLLVNYDSPTFAEQIQWMDRLPWPCVISFANYLHGGFDHQYPDHLPPNERAGSPAEMKRLLDRAHELGLLMSPYTNVTWWCDGPKGPTFLAKGDAALFRGLDGKPAHEDYAGNWGWAITPWHPDVIAASDRVADQFTKEYPADILFQDQVGARRWVFHDTNPAEPTPYAYVQGIVNLSRRSSERLPLATEHGHDRLINVQSEFRGLTWSLVPAEPYPDWMFATRTYRDWIDASDWEAFPLAEFVAGGKAMFGHHGGHPMVATRELLVWSLALGMHLSCAVRPASLAGDAERQWLLYLDRIQKAVVSKYLGQPLQSFRYLSGSGDTGVIEAVYPGVRIVANLSTRPYTFGPVEIAPCGFFADTGDATAGIVSRRGDRRYAPEPLWFVAQKTKTGEIVSAYTRGPVTMEISTPNSPEVLLAPRGTDAAGRAPSSLATAVPSPRGLIGVLAMPIDKGLYEGWGRLSPRNWLDNLVTVPSGPQPPLAVRLIRSVPDMRDALAHPDAWAAIVNPFVELLPEGPGFGRRTALEAIRTYVRAGGIWIETGGYPFWKDAPAADGEGGVSPAPWDGLMYLGLTGAQLREPYVSYLTLSLGADGDKWLGSDFSTMIQGGSFSIERPPVERDYEVCLIQDSSGQPYLLGSRLGGDGLFVRFCSGSPDQVIAQVAVARLMEKRLSHSPAIRGFAPGGWELVSTAVDRK